MVAICFHGTNEKAARAILKDGFASGTYFATHLEDALAFGGQCVFEVRFRIAPKDWQFIIHRHITPSRIRSLTRYKATHLHGRSLAEHFSGYRQEKDRLRCR